jgi:hypothetical protein
MFRIPQYIQNYGKEATSTVVEVAVVVVCIIIMSTNQDESDDEGRANKQPGGEDDPGVAVAAKFLATGMGKETLKWRYKQEHSDRRARIKQQLHTELDARLKVEMKQGLHTGDGTAASTRRRPTDPGVVVAAKYLAQDGCLSCQDLARLCGDLGCELSGEELNAAINILDSDRDGKVLSRFVAQ